jgi:hypothetical protein
MKSPLRMVDLALGAVLLLSSPGESQGQVLAKVSPEQTGTLRLVAPESIPSHGTFWSLQRTNTPPLPFCPFPDLPVYYLGSGNHYLVDDTTVDYVAIYKVREAERALRRLEKSYGLLSAADSLAFELDAVPGALAYRDYLATDLWLELTGITNDYAYLTLHGTVQYDYYQLLSKTNLTVPGNWQLGEVRQDTVGGGQLDFAPVYAGDNPNLFFKAHHAPPVAVSSYGIAVESNAVNSVRQVGSFWLWTLAPNPVTVHYALSGTASNGVDYTNLTGVITIPENGSAYIYLDPKPDTLVEGVEEVILTLLPNDGYVISGSPAVTNGVQDASAVVRVFGEGVDAAEPNGPPGAPAGTNGFYFYRTDANGPMEVRYTFSGTASNGVDYVLRTNRFVFADGQADTNVTIVPLNDSLVEGAETVTLTLIPTNTFLLDPDASNATVNIVDSTTTVGVVAVYDAVEPNPNVVKQTGIFQFTRNDTRGELRALTVAYQVSGMASNGVDYTNLTGTVSILAGQLTTNVFVEPIFDGQFEGDETVTVKLLTNGDGYSIHPTFASATLWIQDYIPTNAFQTVVANVLAPAGIDYHAVSNRLIVSCSYPTGEPFNFLCVYTNLVLSNSVVVTNVTVTNWSGAHGAPDEVKLVTAKSTAGGFTPGDLFFGNDQAVGWVSADGTTSNMTWCVLTNAAVTNAQPIRGSLCQDQTGIYSNNLFVVASDDLYTLNPKGVWRVDAQGRPTLITNLLASHLEGVITLPNDPSQWGPWAGKIITGDEADLKLFAIDASGVRSVP